MSLKEQIESLDWHINMDDSRGGNELAKEQAAELAEEADALMAEMAEALEDQKNCDPTDKRDVLWCHKGIVAALDSYNQYKEQSND